MFKLILFMIIVFNTVPSIKGLAQEARHEAMKAKMDSIKEAHLERSAQIKKEIFDRQQAIHERIEKSNAENTIIINGKTYSAKDSLEMKSYPGIEVKVEGESNSLIIENKGDKNTIIVSQSGQGNKASVNSISKTQPKKENENIF